MGWSCQKPERRAPERNEEAIANWRKQDCPRIKNSPPKRLEHCVDRRKWLRALAGGASHLGTQGPDTNPAHLGSARPSLGHRARFASVPLTGSVGRRCIFVVCWASKWIPGGALGCIWATARGAVGLTPYAAQNDNWQSALRVSQVKLCAKNSCSPSLIPVADH